MVGAALTCRLRLWCSGRLWPGILLAPLAGFEPATRCLEGRFRHGVQLHLPSWGEFGLSVSDRWRPPFLTRMWRSLPNGQRRVDPSGEVHHQIGQATRLTVRHPSATRCQRTAPLRRHTTDRASGSGNGRSESGRRWTLPRMTPERKRVTRFATGWTGLRSFWHSPSGAAPRAPIPPPISDRVPAAAQTAPGR